jgi:hypothetical protein
MYDLGSGSKSAHCSIAMVICAQASDVGKRLSAKASALMSCFDCLYDREVFLDGSLIGVRGCSRSWDLSHLTRPRFGSAAGAIGVEDKECSRGK